MKQEQNSVGFDVRDFVNVMKSSGTLAPRKNASGILPLEH